MEGGSARNNKRKSGSSLVDEFAGKKWREMYPSLCKIDFDDDGPGLAAVSADGSSGTTFDEKVVFAQKPMLDPLVLVQCLDCKKRVKMNTFAAHSERCKRLKAQLAAQQERISHDALLAVGIPKGSKFSRGSSSIKPVYRNVSLYNRWKGERIRQLQEFLRPSSLPQGVDPLTMKFVEEQPPLKDLITTGKKETVPKAESSTSKDSKTKVSTSKRPAKQSSKQTSQKDNKTKSTKKESKEKRKKPKTDSKRKTTKRAPKKASKSRKLKIESEELNGPVTLNLGPSTSIFGGTDVPKATSLILK